MNALYRPARLFAAVVAVAGLCASAGVADEVAPKSNLRGKIEDTAWANQEMKTKDGAPIPKGVIKLTFKKDYSFTFDITGASSGKGKVELKADDAVTLHFDEVFNGRKDHEEQLTIEKDLLTLVDTDGTTLKFDRVPAAKKGAGGILGALKTEPASALKGKIEGTKWTSQATETADGTKLPAGVIALDLNKDMTFTYKAGATTWTGKYELLGGDKLKLLSDQEIGGRKENVETMILKDKTLTMVDADGTKVVFDAAADKPAAKDKNASNNKGKVEGTEWVNQKTTVKETEIPAGLITLKFGADMSLVYKAGAVTWTGKYELMAGDEVKFLTEQDLGGRKDNIEKIAIDGKVLTMTDTDGTQLKFDLTAAKVAPKADPKGKGVSALKGRIEGTNWKSLKATVNGNDIPAGVITIEFKKNMDFVYIAGPMKWTGKYLLLDGDGLKLLSDQDLGGTKENFEKVVIDKDGKLLTMTDPNGTQLKFEKAPADD